MAFALRALWRHKFPPAVEGVLFDRDGYALALEGGLTSNPAKRKIKMDLFKSFSTDAELENSGRWVNLTKTARVRVARAGNEAFNTALRKAIEKEGVDLKDNSKENLDLLQSLMIDATARHILKDWEGMESGGQPLPYTHENAVKALTLKDFRARIDKAADDFDAYRVKEEEAQGNA